MDREHDPDEETQEQRAMRSLQAIFNGADLTTETMQLANEFTDRQTDRFSTWFKRLTDRSGGLDHTNHETLP